MRIAVDARPLCVPTFGIGRYLQSLLTRLVNEDVEWFLYADRPLLVDFPQPNVTVRSHERTNHALSLLRSQLGFARWAAADQVDVYWSPRHHLPLRLPAAIPAAVTIHDLVWKRYPETMLRRNRLVERWLMPPSLRRADAIIAVSGATAADIAADFPFAASKTTVIHEAADLIEVTAPSPETPYFVFLGTLEPRKNLERLISAFGAARSRLPEGCRLKVLGARGWNTRLEALIARLELADVIDLPGHVDDRTLHETLAGAIALCAPSLYEGFGLPPLEAMQHGTPVIASNVSSLPEVVGEGGMLVDPLSIEEMSAAMVDLATNESLRASLSKAALTQARRFSWDRAAAETLRVLQRLASDSA